MRIPRALIITLLVAGGLVVAGWLALRQIPASFGYGIRVEFDTLPANDKPLEEWMKAQPGVVEHTVHVARNGNSVGMLWIMTQSIGPRGPPVPDFRTAFERFGYKGPGPIHYDWRGDNDWPDRGKGEPPVAAGP